jgi:hypothetical protein
LATAHAESNGLYASEADNIVGVLHVNRDCKREWGWRIEVYVLNHIIHKHAFRVTIVRKLLLPL